MEWQQRPDEPDSWFGKFERYYLAQGEGRSLLEAENRYRVGKGRKRSDHNSGAWRGAASKYDWQARAEAHDASLRGEVLEENEDLRRDGMQHIESARHGLRGRVGELVEELVNMALGKGNVEPDRTRLAAINSALDRAGLVKHAPEPLPAEDKDDESGDTSALSDEQLRQIIRILTAAQGAGGADAEASG